MSRQYGRSVCQSGDASKRATLHDFSNCHTQWTPQVTIAQDTIRAMHTQINELKQLVISSSKYILHVPQPLKQKDESETSFHNVDEHDKLTNKDVQGQLPDKVMTIGDLHKVYPNFLAVFNIDQKLNHPEFNGEADGDVFYRLDDTT